MPELTTERPLPGLRCPSGLTPTGADPGSTLSREHTRGCFGSFISYWGQGRQCPGRLSNRTFAPPSRPVPCVAAPKPGAPQAKAGHVPRWLRRDSASGLERWWAPCPGPWGFVVLGGLGARPRGHTQGGLSGDREPSGHVGCSHCGSSGEPGWQPPPGGGGGEKPGAGPREQAPARGRRPPPALEGGVFPPATAAAHLGTEQRSAGNGGPRGRPTL